MQNSMDSHIIWWYALNSVPPDPSYNRRSAVDMKCHLDIATLLLASGADVTAKSGHRQLSALHLATWYRQPAILDLFLRQMGVVKDSSPALAAAIDELERDWSKKQGKRQGKIATLERKTDEFRCLQITVGKFSGGPRVLRVCGRCIL